MSNNATVALVKVARAKQRGTLPDALNVQGYPDTVILSTGIRNQNIDRDLTREAVVLAWLKRQFPGGKTRPESALASFSRKEVRRPRRWFDLYEYRTADVSFRYAAAHQCTEWVANTSEIRMQDSRPVWRCRVCRKSLTAKQVSELHLIPA